MIAPDPWGCLQDDAIDAPEGEKTMPVPMIASMPHELATIWVRWATHLIAVVKTHREIAGVAAASAS